MAKQDEAREEAWAHFTRGEAASAPGDEGRKTLFDAAFDAGWVMAGMGRDTKDAPQKTYVQPPLKEYKDGEPVEVIKNGDWLPGHITSRDKTSGHLHIHTARGPVTVGSTHVVRKLA